MSATPLPLAGARSRPGTSDARELRRSLAVLLFVELFSGFQQSYFVPLLHTVGGQFHVGVTALAWTVTGPALAAAVATPLLTALGDRHGHLRLLRATVAVVAVGAVLIATAPDYPLLVTGRVLQGCLAGFLPLMFGFVRHRHGIGQTRRAIAHLSAALMLGLLLGSACASALLRTTGSGAVLWTPAVGTLVGLGLLWTGPRGQSAASGPAASCGTDRIDWTGVVLLSSGLVLPVLALHEGATWGWSSPATLLCFGAGALLLAGWGASQLRAPAPLIDVRRLLRPQLLPVFAVGCGVHYIVLGGQVSFSTYLTSHDGLGLPASAVGLVLLPAFCGMTLFSAVTSRLGRILGYRNVTVLGSVLLVLGTAGLLLRHSSAADFALTLAVTGAGMGLISGASRILVVDHVRAEETAASEGLFELLVSLSAAVGSAGTASVLAAHGGGTHAYLTAWAISLGIAALGLAASLLLPRHRPPVRRDRP
ncbi:MFS transporter [Streptacidiphilus jiangxiensis]|uniref:Major Facilitator Superfamily protein n=1 Tax=Streptacidiphilus jiangxiensis TaxID=235985 RepID=A0A1H7T465_STRJI|nr:MFS transporter [Streptacidiphilus jiangxiensis]SEL79074.1 Major Facilitator Superfamily protein [Streptacidiphilus jiangxiensis]